jgi:hypothetical protein
VANTALSVYFSAIVACFQNVGANASINPDTIAGIHDIIPEFFNTGVIIFSTIKYIIIQAIAADIADNTFILNAILLTGRTDIHILPVRQYNGYPGGCGIPSVYAEVTISPLSSKPIVGYNVFK